MDDTSRDVDQTDEDALALQASDEALEAAAGSPGGIPTSPSCCILWC